MQKYITVPEMAKIVNIGRNTAYHWAKAGKIPSETILGKIAIPASEISRIAQMVSENARISALRSNGGAA